MIVAKIAEVKKDRVISTGVEFLDVEVEFYETTESGEMNLLEVQKLGFPVDSKSDFIKAEVEKAVANLEQERKSAVLQKEVDAQAEKTDEVIKDLSGITI
jgi:hypothetical protein